jgi:glycosyltransferase involved in cell wall biosynthesis
MRVLQLGKYYYPYMGGIETHLHDLATGLARAVDVEAIVYHTRLRLVRERVDGVDVTRVGTIGRAASTEICPALPFELSTREYDVLHLHAPNPMGMVGYLMAKKSPRHALVVTHHSDVVRQALLRRSFEPVFRGVMSRADAIIVSSQRYLESSRELIPYRGKCVVIPYGIGAERNRSVSQSEVRGLRALYGPRVVLAVGRLIYYKGFEVLVDAMRSVDGTLVLVGSGPLRARIAYQIREFGLSKRVFLVGEVHNHELASYYGAADVFAFPSIARSEAFGIAQLEAMAAGLPVVNTAIESGVPSVSRDGLTGLTVPAGDAKCLAAAISQLLDNPDMRARFGREGRRRVEVEFASDLMVRRVLDLYRRLLAHEPEQTTDVPGNYSGAAASWRAPNPAPVVR